VLIPRSIIYVCNLNIVGFYKHNLITFIMNKWLVTRCRQQQRCQCPTRWTRRTRTQRNSAKSTCSGNSQKVNRSQQKFKFLSEYGHFSHLAKLQWIPSEFSVTAVPGFDVELVTRCQCPTRWTRRMRTQRNSAKSTCSVKTEILKKSTEVNR